MFSKELNYQYVTVCAMFVSIGRETLLVKTFGEVTPKLVTSDIVQMCVCILEIVLLFIFLAIQYQRFVAQ